MAKTFEAGKQYPLSYIKRNFTEYFFVNPNISKRKIPKINPRQEYKVKFDMGQDEIASERAVPTDTYYLETTDLNPETSARVLSIDISVFVIFEAIPSGNFRCEIFNEAYYVPWEYNPVTGYYEPTSILGERLPQTQEEIDFDGTISDRQGSLKKWGSLQESERLLYYSQPAATEGENVINIQIARKRYVPVDFNQNLIYMTLRHTADTSISLKQASMTIVVTERNS